MEAVWIATFALLLLWRQQASATMTCVQDGCACNLMDTKNNTIGRIDLTQVTSSNPMQPYFNISKGYRYYFNPCQAMNIHDPCNQKDQTSVCQQEEGTTNYFPLGRVDQLSFQTNGSYIQAFIQVNPSDPGARKTYVGFICLGSQKTPKLSFLAESPPGHYWFALHWKEYCFTSSNKGLSVGSILVICFFALVVVYFAAGVVIMRVRKGASGLELIPNRDLWADLPLLIKDGMCFICGRCRGQGDYKAIQ